MPKEIYDYFVQDMIRGSEWTGNYRLITGAHLDSQGRMHVKAGKDSWTAGEVRAFVQYCATHNIEAPVAEAEKAR